VAGRELCCTLEIATGAAVLAAAAGLVVGGWAASRRSLLVQLLAVAPLGVPALLVGLAYSEFYNRTWPVDLRALGDASSLVILGLAARGWPLATRAVVSGCRRIAPEWRDAAQLAGWHGPRQWRWLTGPLLADPIVVGAVAAFVVAVGDVEISQMLCAPGDGTLSLRLLTFLHFGPAHTAAGLALLQLIVATAPVILYFLWTNRHVPVV
jgi:ABC-type Fe3+ transport system permease subunit